MASHTVQNWAQMAMPQYIAAQSSMNHGPHMDLASALRANFLGSGMPLNAGSVGRSMSEHRPSTSAAPINARIQSQPMRQPGINASDDTREGAEPLPSLNSGAPSWLPDVAADSGTSTTSSPATAGQNVAVQDANAAQPAGDGIDWGSVLKNINESDDEMPAAGGNNGGQAPLQQHQQVAGTYPLGTGSGPVHAPMGASAPLQLPTQPPMHPALMQQMQQFPTAILHAMAAAGLAGPMHSQFPAADVLASVQNWQAQMHAQLRAAATEIELLQSVLAQTGERAKELQSENSSLQQLLENSKSALVTAQQAGIEHVTAARAKAGIDQAAAAATISKLQSDVSKLSSDAAASKAEVDKARAQTRQARDEAKAMKDEAAKLRSELKAAHEAASALKSEAGLVPALREQLSKAQTEAAKSAQRASVLQKQLQSEKDKYTKEQQKLSKQLDGVVLDMNSRDGEMDSLRRAVTASHESMQSLRSDLTKLAKDCETLRTDVQSKEAVITDLQRQLAVARDGEASNKASTAGWRSKFVQIGQELTKVREQHEKDRQMWEVIFEALRKNAAPAKDAQADDSAKQTSVEPQPHPDVNGVDGHSPAPAAAPPPETERSTSIDSDSVPEAAARPEQSGSVSGAVASVEPGATLPVIDSTVDERRVAHDGDGSGESNPTEAAIACDERFAPVPPPRHAASIVAAAEATVAPPRELALAAFVLPSLPSRGFGDAGADADAAGAQQASESSMTAAASLLASISEVDPYASMPPLYEMGSREERESRRAKQMKFQMMRRTEGGIGADSMSNAGETPVPFTADAINSTLPTATSHASQEEILDDAVDKGGWRAANATSHSDRSTAELDAEAEDSDEYALSSEEALELERAFTAATATSASDGGTSAGRDGDKDSVMPATGGLNAAVIAAMPPEQSDVLRAVLEKRAKAFSGGSKNKTSRNPVIAGTTAPAAFESASSVRAKAAEALSRDEVELAVAEALALALNDGKAVL